MKFSGLIDDFQSDRDVIKYVGGFAADFSNSRLYKVISDKDAEIDFQKAELLESLKYLQKVCEKISSVFTDISNAPSTWFKDEEMKKMIFSDLSKASRWLNGLLKTSFFKVEKFNIDEVGKCLKACIKQLCDEK